MNSTTHNPIANPLRGAWPLAAALSILWTLAAAAPAAAQQDQPEAEFGETVEVQEVLLDVLVTDRRGDVIIGLGPDDFKVTEDGEPVKLTGVTFYSSSELLGSAEELAARGTDIDTAPKDRYFILFLDDQRSNQDSGVNLVQRQLQAMRDARAWVDSELAPADWVAVLGYNFKLKLYQDFTRDRRAIDAALKRAAAGRGGDNWPSRREQGADPSLASGLPYGDELRDASTRIYGALELVAEAAGSVVGRKNLVLFSVGFGDVDRAGIYQRDQRFYPDMVQALNDNNVAVYSVDLTPSDVRHPLANALNDVATETGGRFFERFTSFRTPLRQIADENSGYYLLSYRSAKPAAEQGFQQVEVEALNPELEVRARRGYAY